MKPFITDALIDGRYILNYQIEGIEISELSRHLVGSNIIGYVLPNSQSLACAWELKLIFDNGISIDFSSACTNIGGWQEMGSLNIFFSDYISDNNLDISVYQKSEVSFFVKSMDKLVFESSDVFSESGIIFLNGNGEEIIIATGVSPGSISVKAPFCEANFNSELELEDCHRIVMQ